MQQLLMMMIMNLHLLFHVLQLIFLLFIIPGTYCVLLAWAGIAIVMIYYFLCGVDAATRRTDYSTRRLVALPPSASSITSSGTVHVSS